MVFNSPRFSLQEGNTLVDTSTKNNIIALTAIFILFNFTEDKNKKITILCCMKIKKNYLFLWSTQLINKNKIKKLISQHTEKKTERYPAQMTVEELKEVLKKSIEESKQGLGMTTEELRKRHPLCK